MKHLAILLLFLAFPVLGAETISAKLVPIAPSDRTPDLYRWIEAMWSGPWRSVNSHLTEDDPMEEPRAERWRLVYFPNSEETPPRLELERLTQGDEGCCNRIAARFLFDIGGDVQRFKFGAWSGVGGFTFSIGEVVYEASGLEKGELRVRRASAA